jgi:hypothetical protein
MGEMEPGSMGETEQGSTGEMEQGVLPLFNSPTPRSSDAPVPRCSEAPMLPAGLDKGGTVRRRAGRSAGAVECMRQLAAARREGTKGSHVEALCQTLFDMAIGGDVAAAKVILEYLEGRPVARVQAAAAHPAGTSLPLFTADEATEAERKLHAWRDGLIMSDAEDAA